MSETIAPGPRERRALKARARELEPRVKIGKKGLSKPITDEISRLFEGTDLLKVKIERSIKKEAPEICAAIAEACGCALLQRVGHIAVLYRARG